MLITEPRPVSPWLTVFTVFEAAAAEWVGQEQTRSWHSPTLALGVQLKRLQGEQEAEMLVPSSPLTPGRLRDLKKNTFY